MRLRICWLKKTKMKNNFKVILSIALCVNFILCSSSCTQNDSSKSSNSSSIQPQYQYKPLSEIPSFPDFDAIFESIHTYVITYSIELEYNHSVGNEWKYGVRYNDEYISSSSKIVITDSPTEIELVAFATELDKWNDYGKTYITFDALKVGQKQTKYATVIVRENEGRYTGNTAKWYFEITIERI